MLTDTEVRLASFQIMCGSGRYGLNERADVLPIFNNLADARLSFLNSGFAVPSAPQQPTERAEAVCMPRRTSLTTLMAKSGRYDSLFADNSVF